MVDLFGRFSLVGLVLVCLAWYEVNIKNEDDLTILTQPRDKSNLKPESDLENRGPPQKNEEHVKTWRRSQKLKTSSKKWRQPQKERLP